MKSEIPRLGPSPWPMIGDSGSGPSSRLGSSGRTTIYGEEPPSRQWNLRLRGEASAKLDDPQGGGAVTRERERDGPAK